MKEFLDRLLDYYHLTKDDYLKLIAPVREDNFAYGHKFDRIDEAICRAARSSAKTFHDGD